MSPRERELKNQELNERLAVAAVVLLLVIGGLVGFKQIQRLQAQTDLVAQSYQLLGKVDRLESQLKSAETGQRGFIITGEESYLEPYTLATDEIAGLLEELTLSASAPEKAAKLAILQPLINAKLEELAAAIQLRRTSGFEESQLLVANNVDNRTMDSITDTIGELREIENSEVSSRELAASSSYASALLITLVSSIAALSLVIAVLFLVQRNRQRAELAAGEIRAEHERLQASLNRNTLLELENQQMDQYMRTIVEQVQDYAIFGMDSECRATTWNEGVFKVLGFEEQDFIGQDIRELIFTPEAIALGIPMAEFAMAAKEGSASDDRWMMQKDGKKFWASGITSAVTDDSGQLVGFSKVMRDLTEKKRHEDELAEMAAKLSEYNRRMNEFLATLAHELRNPLAPIKSAVELLSMSPLTDENEELRATIARQVEQIICLIDDLLDVSRIGRGKIKLQKQVGDLRNMIDLAVEATQPMVADKQQTVDVEQPNEEVLANVDSPRIVQVVTNLLTNACRYSDRGSHISVTMTVDAGEGEHGTALIEVRDNGIGIREDRLDEIFQMFAQVDDTLGRGEAGLGIGLTLVKTLVELHGGAVAAQSDGIDQGSHFSIRLPMSPTQLAHEQKLQKQQPVEEEPVMARHFRVLIVEDLRALRIIMSRLLQRLGHEVRGAEDGLAALECLTEYTPDVIFSDISMPGITGYDLAARIRQQEQLNGVYLVAMSGYGQLSDRVRSRDSGFDEHMVKPVDVNKLRELFDRLSRGH